MIIDLSSLELLVISLFFVTSINCVITYVCCVKSLKILEEEKALSKAVNKLRIYDQYLLSKINVIIALLYFWLCYLCVEDFLPNSNYVFLFSCLLAFPFTLITTFLSRVCYCYTGNVLLETKLNEIECLVLNFKRLLSFYLPFIIISVIVPTVYLLKFSEVILNSICIGLLLICLILWVFLAPKFTVWNFKATEVQKMSLLRHRLVKLMDKHGVRRYKLYVWDSSRSRESNAMVSGFRTCYLFISSCLIEEVTLPELETVITHEIGHIKNRHLIKIMIGKIFILSSLVFIALIPYIFSVSGLEKVFIYFISILLFVLEIVIGAKVERNYEKQADVYAAGYNDPELFESAIRKISKYDYEESNFVDNMFQSHPGIKERITNVSKKED